MSEITQRFLVTLVAIMTTSSLMSYLKIKELSSVQNAIYSQSIQQNQIMPDGKENEDEDIVDIDLDATQQLLMYAHIQGIREDVSQIRKDISATKIILKGMISLIEDVANIKSNISRMELHLDNIYGYISSIDNKL